MEPFLKMGVIFCDLQSGKTDVCSIKLAMLVRTGVSINLLSFKSLELIFLSEIVYDGKNFGEVNIMEIKIWHNAFGRKIFSKIISTLDKAR